MKHFDLKGEFRRAVLVSLTALALIFSFGVPARNRANANENTGSNADSPTSELIFTPCTEDVYKTRPEWTAWGKRQDFITMFNNSADVRYGRWLSKLDGAQNLSLTQKAHLVDSLVNASVTWVSDSANYGAGDYWAPAIRTILSRKGDCEDFSIAKFDALQYLGVPEERMGILVVATDSSKKVLNHAVVAVDTSANNSWTNCIVLDNRADIQKTFKQTGYAPLYLVRPGEISTCTVNKPAPVTAQNLAPNRP